jgi:uncharacterized cupin superfamily protein
LPEPPARPGSASNRIQVEPGRRSTPAHIESAGAPPHCHSAEDEFFIVLDGEGTLHVDPTPAKVEFGGKSEEHPVRRGSVASFAAGANLCHSLRAGEDGLTFLAYGTRQPHDVIYYLRRNALFFSKASA